jgi:cell division septum initiation protein DivIVA
MYGTSADPFTPEYFKDILDLKKKRRDMLKEAKYIKELGEKLNQDITKAQNTFKRARDMEKKILQPPSNQ